MTPTELQQAINELSTFDNSVTYPSDREPDPVTPMLFNIAVDPPYGNNDSGEHDREFVYMCWLTTAELEKLKAESKGRISYWRAGWYPNADAMIAQCGGDDPIWQDE